MVASSGDCHFPSETPITTLYCFSCEFWGGSNYVPLKGFVVVPVAHFKTLSSTSESYEFIPSAHEILRKKLPHETASAET